MYIYNPRCAAAQNPEPARGPEILKYNIVCGGVLEVARGAIVLSGVAAAATKDRAPPAPLKSRRVCRAAIAFRLVSRRAAASRAAVAPPRVVSSSRPRRRVRSWRAASTRRRATSGRSAASCSRRVAFASRGFVYSRFRFCFFSPLALGPVGSAVLVVGGRRKKKERQE